MIWTMNVSGFKPPLLLKAVFLDSDLTDGLFESKGSITHLI